MEQTLMADLKPQGQLRKIDFSHPKMQPMIRMLQNNIRRETQAWQPETNMQLHRRAFSVKGKDTFSCLILEPEAPLGACLLCHGGGMIFPLQVSSLRVAQYLAREAHLTVWVPDYHLPPDAPFPVPVEECRCVWDEMTRTEEHSILYGESIGGAVALSLSMLLRDGKARQPERLMLIDPVTDCETETYPSAALDDRAEWTMKNNRYMWEIYLPNPEAAYGVPMREKAEGLPPTFLETAETDILRDEGEAFGKKLQDAGVSVEMHRIPGAWHGFDTEIHHPYVRRTLDARVEYIRNIFR